MSKSQIPTRKDRRVDYTSVEATSKLAFILKETSEAIVVGGEILK